MRRQFGLRPEGKNDQRFGLCAHLAYAIHPKGRLLMLWRAPPAGARAPWSRSPLSDHDLAEADMQAISTIGLDIAKSVFQVHGRQSAGGQFEADRIHHPGRARASVFSGSWPPGVWRLCAIQFCKTVWHCGCRDHSRSCFNSDAGIEGNERCSDRRMDGAVACSA